MKVIYFQSFSSINLIEKILLVSFSTNAEKDIELWRDFVDLKNKK